MPKPVIWIIAITALIGLANLSPDTRNYEPPAPEPKHNEAQAKLIAEYAASDELCWKNGKPANMRDGDYAAFLEDLGMRPCEDLVADFNRKLERLR